MRGHQLHTVSFCCGHYIQECKRRGMLLSCFGQRNQTRCLGSRKAALPVCPPHSTSGTHCVGSSLLRFADSLGVTETQLYVQQPLGKPCRALRGSVMGDSSLGAWAHVRLSRCESPSNTAPVEGHPQLVINVELLNQQSAQPC